LLLYGNVVIKHVHYGRARRLRGVTYVSQPCSKGVYVRQGELLHGTTQVPQDGLLCVLQFSDVICKYLRQKLLSRKRLLQRHNIVDGNGFERIADGHGNLQYTLTETQHARGRNVGKSIQQNCYMCRKYLDESGNTTCNQTNFRCRHCPMLLCKK